MLSREDQHHLDEIERCLETTDPAFGESRS
jgi:hypothetical protein